MIKLFAIINKQGQVRFYKFYDRKIKENEYESILKSIFEQLNKRDDKNGNFIEQRIEESECNLVLREVQNVYLLMLVDQQESVLATIDIIQVIVEILDKLSSDTIEHYLMHTPHKAALVFDEIIMAGVVIETHVQEVMAILHHHNIHPVNKNK